MAMEVTGDSSVMCYSCGRVYTKRKGNFSPSYASPYKAVGYLPLCKHCVQTMYDRYYEQASDTKKAMRQLCRALNLYWSDDLYERTMRVKNVQPNTVPTTYISKSNTYTYAGKSYEDTLIEEKTLYAFGEEGVASAKNGIGADADILSGNEEALEEVPQEVKDFWGNGYSSDMYHELEQRRKYWMSKFPKDVDLDIGTEALIRQICSLELDINRDRIAGKSVDKSVNALNTLLGSANLKPAQQKDKASLANEKTPFGVWIQRWETKRPIPEPDPDLQDVDGIKKYIGVWLYGHLGKMLNIKNTYSEEYEEEIKKYSVERPEYTDDEEEDDFYDIFSDSEEGRHEKKSDDEAGAEDTE